MKWIFWLFIVSIISTFALMGGIINKGFSVAGTIIAFSAWGLFICAIFFNQERYRKRRNRQEMIDMYLRQQLRK